MTQPAKRSGSQHSIYRSIREYNAAYPHAPMPGNVTIRNSMRGFTCASTGLATDAESLGKKLTLEFLPGGAPAGGEPDRIGTVVAGRWGDPPYLVLAENVSLRQAWEAITTSWPTTLFGVLEVLNTLAAKRPR